MFWDFSCILHVKMQQVHCEEKVSKRNLDIYMSIYKVNLVIALRIFVFSAMAQNDWFHNSSYCNIYIYVIVQHIVCILEPQLCKPVWRRTISSDNGVQINEGMLLISWKVMGNDTSLENGECWLNIGLDNWSSIVFLFLGLLFVASNLGLCNSEDVDLIRVSIREFLWS